MTGGSEPVTSVSSLHPSTEAARVVHVADNPLPPKQVKDVISFKCLEAQTTPEQHIKQKLSAERSKGLKYFIVGICALVLMTAAIALIVHGGVLVLPFLHFAMHTQHMVYATLAGIGSLAVACYVFVQAHETGKEIEFLHQLAASDHVLKVLGSYDESAYERVIAIFKRCPSDHREKLAKFWEKFSEDQSLFILDRLKECALEDLTRLSDAEEQLLVELLKDSQNADIPLTSLIGQVKEIGLLHQLGVSDRVLKVLGSYDERVIAIFKRCPSEHREKLARFWEKFSKDQLLLILDRLKECALEDVTRLSDAEEQLLMELLKDSQNADIPLTFLIAQAKEWVRFDAIVDQYPLSLQEALISFFDTCENDKQRIDLIQVLEKCHEDKRQELGAYLLTHFDQIALLANQDVDSWKLT